MWCVGVLVLCFQALGLWGRCCPISFCRSWGKSGECSGGVAGRCLHILLGLLRSANGGVLRILFCSTFLSTKLPHKNSYLALCTSRLVYTYSQNDESDLVETAYKTPSSISKLGSCSLSTHEHTSSVCWYIK